ncbi:MAG: cupredoxin domain-containing protein [Nitrosospira sp.]|nr:cupredoxin domain-containing protein [Nitrosospira sp.]
MRKILMASALTLSMISASAYAGENHGSGDISLGSPGDPTKISRTIEITMIDNRFKPSEVNVKQGETVKFMLKNTGEKKHEMMIASPEELDKHAKMMKKFPDMEHHNEPNMITVNSGKTGELVWHFTEAGTVNFSCPMPGHSKGMHGTIEVQAK